MQESLRFALQNIRANVMRTLLSLLGVTIGVFCIISILTLIDSMEHTIKGSLSKFGTNTFFIQKWPWGFDSEYPWWKYVNRPQLRYQEMVQLQKRLPDAEAIAFMVRMGGNKIATEKASAENITLQGISHEYDKAMEIRMEPGRFFTEDESQRGDNVIILGYDLATALFGSGQKAIGKDLKTFNRTLRVVGVMEKQGNGLGMGSQEDNGAMVPINFIRKLASSDEDQFGPTI